MTTDLNQNKSEFRVCGGWCEGTHTCMMIGGSKHLTRECYDPVDASKPKHPCTFNCGNHLHSSMCSAIEGATENKEEWLCITCRDQTRGNNNNNNKKKKKKKPPLTGEQKRKAIQQKRKASLQQSEEFAAAFPGTRRGPVVTPASTDTRSSHTTTPHAHRTQPGHYETIFQTPNQLNHPHRSWLTPNYTAPYYPLHNQTPSGSYNFPAVFPPPPLGYQHHQMLQQHQQIVQQQQQQQQQQKSTISTVSQINKNRKANQKKNQRTKNRKNLSAEHTASSTFASSTSSIALAAPVIGTSMANIRTSLPTNTNSTPLNDTSDMYANIDQWYGPRTWAALAGRSIESGELFTIAQYHAYINCKVQRLTTDPNSTGAHTRSYKCKQGCGWTVLFRRTKGVLTWTLDDDLPSRPCQCRRVTIGIPGPTVVNLPQFHNLVRNAIPPHETMSQAAAIKKLKTEQIHVSFKGAQYSKCTVAATKFILGVIVPREFRELPTFLNLLAQKNKNLTVALQSDAISNSFFRLFVGFPIAQEIGKLTMDVMVTDCFHQKCKIYDGAVMHIVSRTGFGRTVLCAIAIIPIEDTNHIAWVIQMCWRHGMELKCGLFTDQGPLLSAAKSLFEKFQIKLKLQLCLQHIIRCIRAMFPTLFTKKEKKTKRKKREQGVSNDTILRRSVHVASYCEKVSVFFCAIEEMVIQLVQQNPTNVVDCIGVGIYLLDLHPHLWTVIANTEGFSMNNDYYPGHRSLYTSFLTCNHFVAGVSASSKGSKQFTPSQLNAILRTTAEKCKTEFEAMTDPSTHLFQFKDIVSDANPAPRYSNSKTNIGEMFGNLMKQNGARYKNPVLFLHHALRLYNAQVTQLRSDLEIHKDVELTTIGYKIKSMIGKDSRFSQNKVSMMDSHFECGEGDGDVWDQLQGDFSYESGGIAETHHAFLKWDATCEEFRHSCSEHGDMSDMLRCPCTCIFLLCAEAIRKEHLPPRFKRSDDIDHYLYGPCFRIDFCLNLLRRKYTATALRGLRVSIPTASDMVNSGTVNFKSFSNGGVELKGEQVCSNLQQPTKYKDSFSGGPRFTSTGESGTGNSIRAPRGSNKSRESKGRYANEKTRVVKVENVTSKLPKLLLAAKNDKKKLLAAENDKKKNDNDRLNVLVKVKVEKDDDDSSDSGGLSVSDFLLSQDMETALDTIYRDKRPKHCSFCRLPNHNVKTCVPLHTNGRDVCPARELHAGKYHVYSAPHKYAHDQVGFPLELYAQSDARTTKIKKNDKLFCRVIEEDEDDDDDDDEDERTTTLPANNGIPSCSLAVIDKDNISKKQLDDENKLDEATYKSPDYRFTARLDCSLNEDIYQHQTSVRPQWGQKLAVIVYAIYTNNRPSDCTVTIIERDDALTLSQSSQKTDIAELFDEEQSQDWMALSQPETTASNHSNPNQPCNLYTDDLAYNFLLQNKYEELPVWSYYDTITKKVADHNPQIVLATYTGKATGACIVDRNDLDSLICGHGKYVESEILKFFGSQLVDLDPKHYGMVSPEAFEHVFPLEGEGPGRFEIFDYRKKYSHEQLLHGLREMTFENGPKPNAVGIAPGIFSIPIYCVRPKHWILCIVLTESGRVIMLDTSLDENHQLRRIFYTKAVPAFLKKYISHEEPHKDWTVEWPPCPVQTISDCGVFVCVFMYIFAVFYSGDLDQTLSMIRKISQHFVMSEHIRHTIALCILKKDLSFMNERLKVFSEFELVITGRQYIRETLGLNLHQLRKEFTDKNTTIIFPIVAEGTPDADKTLFSTWKFVGSILSTEELRGSTGDNSADRTHNFKEVDFDYQGFTRIQKAIRLYEQSSSEGRCQNVTRQRSSSTEALRAAWATDSMIDSLSIQYLNIQILTAKVKGYSEWFVKETGRLNTYRDITGDTKKKNGKSISSKRK